MKGRSVRVIVATDHTRVHQGIRGLLKLRAEVPVTEA